jgi:dienelactone hydrolase
MRILLALAAAFALATAARAAPPLEAYGRAALIQAVALSPSGDRFAIAVADPKGGWNLIVRTTSGAPVAGQSFKVSQIRALEFAGEDHVLLFQTATAKAPVEFGWARSYQHEDVVDFNIKTRASAMLPGSRTTIYSSIFGWHGVRQVGGRWYAYLGAIRIGSAGSPKEQAYFPDLYRVDLDSGELQSVAVSAQRPRGWLIGADGQVAANTVFEPRQKQWSVYLGATISDHPLLQRSGSDSVGLLGPGRTPGTFLISEKVDEATTIREIRVDGQGDGEVLAAGESAVGEFFDRETGLLVGMTTLREQRLFDPVLQKRIDIAHQVFPGDRARVVAHSRNFDRIIFLTDGPGNAGRYWLVDAVGRTANPLGEVHPGIAPADVGATRMFAYKAADGLAMEGVLTLPPGRDPKSLPVVVMPHGGPIAAGDQAGFDWWAQAFASRGYAVFQANFRGSLGYGDAFRSAANGEFGRKMLTDVSDGVAALAASGIVDPKRACIVGASYGGYAALAGVTLQHGLYRCAVSLAGIADVDKLIFWIREHSSLSGMQMSDQQWRTMTGRAIGENGTVSPLHAAAAADAPILLLHGEADRTVPIEQSEMMKRALAGAGKPVDFVSLAQAGHDLFDPAARQAMLNASIAFVQKHNPAS